MSEFDYSAMTSRNIGFVTEAEQQRLRAGRVFVCGTGGMGGACLQSLVRAGVSAFEIADFDVFEVSNLNRQVFCTLADVGREKVQVTAERLRGINPEVQVQAHGERWLDQLGDILTRCRVVVNGMDDIAAGVRLYRAARERDATVIDAYASTLPSVIVVGPQDPRPEERLRFPTLGAPPERFTPEILTACKLAEIEYVLVHSSTSRHIVPGIAEEIISGKRPRISFAPMVITTGNLLAYEAIAALTGRPHAADYRGWFLNPYTGRIERPRAWPVAALRRTLVRRAMRAS
ncbi:MAG: HesA/MoeB/ThiF family protein [Candidatus Eiseniibacteriota bacterium]